jgi:UTP--glucose-1-phosphate uridylyltransferase
MNIRKALITAANPAQRTLPLQVLVDRAGVSKPALQIILEEADGAGIEEFVVVVCPGDQRAYGEAAGPYGGRVQFLEQAGPRGYGHAVLLGRKALEREDAFLHLVGDHLYVSGGGRGDRGDESCARQLVEVAAAERAAVSAVQATREALLPYFGAVSGRLVPGGRRLYQIDAVLEKPSPTEAERLLLVPGLRAGHYLCFFGLHVLTPQIFELLAQSAASAGDDTVLPLSPALHALSARERYLALEISGSRYDIGGRYGLLFAQFALSLAGRDRDLVLRQLLELVAQG